LEDDRWFKLGIEENELIEDLNRLSIDGRLVDCEGSVSDMLSTGNALNEVLLEATLGLGERVDGLRPDVTEPDRYEKYDVRRLPAAEILLRALPPQGGGTGETLPRGLGLEGAFDNEMLRRKLVLYDGVWKSGAPTMSHDSRMAASSAFSSISILGSFSGVGSERLCTTVSLRKFVRSCLPTCLQALYYRPDNVAPLARPY
jgi:hypothetical protein